MKPKYFIILLFVCLIIFLTQLNYLYVDIMEARNFVSAREMVENGNWVFTSLNGLPRYQKPPLPTWLSALMIEFFGKQTLWALRLPAAIASVTLVLFFYKLNLLFTKKTQFSFITSLILATSFLVIFIGKRASWDIFCYSFCVVGIYYLFKSILDEKINYTTYILAGLFFGLSFLSKGPTGIYVIVIPSLIAFIWSFGFPDLKHWKAWILMGFLTILIGFSWYVYIYLNDQNTLLEILKTEAAARVNRDVKSPIRYLSFPIQMGIWAIFTIFSLFFPYLKKKVEIPETYLFFFYWVLICLVLLSLIPSKKERYLFPLMIPLATTTGFYIYYLIQTVDLKLWEKWISKTCFGVIGMICLILPISLLFILKLNLGVYEILFCIVSILNGIYILFQSILKQNFFRSFYGTVFFMASAVFLGTPVLEHIINNNPEFKSITTAQEMINSSGEKLYGFDNYSPEIWFKYGAIIPNISSEKIPKEEAFYLLIRPNEEKKLKALLNSKNINWTLELIGDFDDNEEGKSSKNYVNRKLNRLYKVVKN